MPPESWRGKACSKPGRDRKSTRLNSSHLGISYAVFCLQKNTRQELLHFLRARQSAADIRVYPANELLICAEIGWQDAEHPRLCEGMLRDELNLGSMGLF